MSCIFLILHDLFSLRILNTAGARKLFMLLQRVIMPKIGQKNILAQQGGAQISPVRRVCACLEGVEAGGVLRVSSYALCAFLVSVGPETMIG